MRTRIDFVAGRMAHNLEESGTRIVLVSRTWPPGATRDPVTQVYTGNPTEVREEIRAFLHFISASSSVRQFNEIQVGDCMVDMSPSVVLTGRDGLSFLLPTGAIPAGGGEPALETWSNKPVSSQLAAYWDTMQSGRRVVQTVLLRRAT